MRRIAFVLAAVVSIAAGCSGTPERPVAGASPTGASLVNAQAASVMLMGLTGLDTGALIGPLGTPMPSRSEALVFRRALDVKYVTALGRSSTNLTYVDIEGDVVWTMEYIRYRVSGCDHSTAVQRVAAQIAGNPPGADCGSTPEGAVIFPPRQDVLAFRRGLDDIYLQMGRTLIAGPVDIEGSVVFTSEYLRYRTNGCDATVSQQKVFDQIDGKGVADTCYVPPACGFFFEGGPFPTVSALGGTFTTVVRRFSGLSTCSWSASSDSPLITLTGETTGGDFGVITYRMAQNTGLTRSGRIRVSISDGTTIFLTVSQPDRQFAAVITMIDNKESTAPTTECQIKPFGGGATTCTLVATAQLVDVPVRYVWSATWDYFGTTRTFTQDGTSNTFAISEQCNALANPTAGTLSELSVTLTVYDVRGNQQLVITGQGQQPTLYLRLLHC